MLKGQIKIKEDTINSYKNLVENGYFYKITRAYTGKNSE